MGLDIYFSKVTKLPESVEQSNAKKREVINARIDKVNRELGECVTGATNYNQLADEYDLLLKWYNEYVSPSEELAYFRKVNFLLPFFDYTENCESKEITFDQIHSLIEACKAVLADHSKAGELLPPTDGFFFGSTELDEWYFNDVEDVLKQFTDILDKMPESEREQYKVEMYCWW